MPRLEGHALSSAKSSRANASRSSRTCAKSRLFLPKSPLARVHDPQSEQQIGSCVGENARTQTAASIGNVIIERAADKCRDPVWPGMTKRERNRHNDKRGPAKFTEWHPLKFFIDQKAQKKRAPENFLHHRNNENETKKAKSWTAGLG